MEQNQELWVVVELMGRDRVAGRYLFENGLHRVDVPYEDGFKTQSIGAGAIFRMHYVDEATARLVAKQLEPRPIGIYELEKEVRRLAAQVEPEDYDYIDDDEEF